MITKIFFVEWWLNHTIHDEEKMNEKSITDAAWWIVDQHSQKKNYANLPESFGIGGLDDAYLVQQEVVGFFIIHRGRIGGHKLALTSKPI